MAESLAEAPGDARGGGGANRELLQRLRELEEENSALAQANENQRETYERCLDEVANHVVQALLNQKDLREECLKLKKRVAELERQNRALSDLCQQRLQPPPGPPPAQLRPLSPDPPGSPERPPAPPPHGCCAPPAQVGILRPTASL
ncbi:nck-associated protein 5-like isoform X3 [Gallus gallus]|uniref:nck-associated protein 5-like isoform X3 n=1 Tax=Gallus gallus TaxID=9031 RepID=UPI001AE14BDC|nr:nck-associated protein 5-like isoform X3 [Gallus gallus]